MPRHDRAVRDPGRSRRTDDRRLPGVRPALIRTFADEWVVGLTDLTPQVHRIADLVRAGRAAQAQRLLPPERPYRLPAAIARRLGAD
ncbi:DUF4291 family protein [Kitasatospora sp. NPDC048722]|uniref:DUF4291 family protein n=1 Tax=Kitasatospora sp. NPDC048722 TaxID=3155639 RepID=UPI0034065CCB